MAPNVQTGGIALLVDARIDATVRAAGIALLVDAIRTPVVASTGHYAYII